VTTTGADLLKAALDRVAPLLANQVDLTTITTSASSASPASTAPVVKSAAFIDIEVAAEYFRPNGVAYVPRRMPVGAEVIHDVTFLRASARLSKPCLLYGPPGTGKTALIEAAFPTVVTVQGTIETETADFVGSWVANPDGTYSWVDGPLVVAAENGLPLFIDEIALIDPRSLAVVYGAMDGRGEIVVTQNPKRGAVKVQPGFIVMGAFNPNVPGAVLSDALLSRFPIQIEVQTDWTLAKDLGVPAKIIQIARNLARKVETAEMTGSPQLRELLDYRDLAGAFGEDFALQNFLGQIRPENREVAVSVIETVMGRKPSPLSLYR